MGTVLWARSVRTASSGGASESPPRARRRRCRQTSAATTKPIKQSAAATPSPIHSPTGSSSAPLGAGKLSVIAELGPSGEFDALPGDIDDGAVTETETDAVPLFPPVLGEVDVVSETEPLTVDEPSVDEVDRVDEAEVSGTKSVPHCAGRQVLAVHAVSGWLATQRSMRAHCAKSAAHSQPKDHGSLGCLPHSSRIRPIRLGLGTHASYREAFVGAHVNVVVVVDCAFVNSNNCNNTNRKFILSCLIFVARESCNPN